MLYITVGIHAADGVQEMQTQYVSCVRAGSQTVHRVVSFVDGRTAVFKTSAW